jgi:hypothetical protein
LGGLLIAITKAAPLAKRFPLKRPAGADPRRYGFMENAYRQIDAIETMPMPD